MTNKPGLWFDFRKCFRKKRYDSLKAARKQARADLSEHGVVQYPYECANCGSFHLTHKPHDGVPTL